MERCFECSAQVRILADWANWQPYLYDRWKTQGYSSQKKGDKEGNADVNNKTV